MIGLIRHPKVFYSKAGLMALKQVEDHYNSLSPAEREAYKRKYYPKSSSAIERLSRSIESDHAYMSEAEWEAETIARMRRWREQQRQSD